MEYIRLVYPPGFPSPSFLISLCIKAGTYAHVLESLFNKVADLIIKLLIKLQNNMHFGENIIKSLAKTQSFKHVLALSRWLWGPRTRTQTWAKTLCQKSLIFWQNFIVLLTPVFFSSYLTNLDKFKKIEKYCLLDTWDSNYRNKSKKS